MSDLGKPELRNYTSDPKKSEPDCENSEIKNQTSSPKQHNGLLKTKKNEKKKRKAETSSDDSESSESSEKSDYITSSDEDEKEKKEKKTKMTKGIIVNNMISDMMLRYFVKKDASEEKDSMIVSPFGLVSSFSMLLLGLTDETLEEIQKELLVGDKDDFFEEIVELTNIVNKYVKTNNFILTKDEICVFETYLKKVNKLGQLLTFKQKEIPKLVGRVNKIVKDNTNNNIKDLVKSSDVNNFTFLVLINTLYMDLKWVHNFNSFFTLKEKFYGLNNKMRTVSMMNMYEKKLRYNQKDNYQMVELPFDSCDGRLAMYVVLPTDRTGKPIDLTPTKFRTCQEELKFINVNLKLPKFETRSELDLIPFFKQKNMLQMFKYMHADDMIMRRDEQKVDAIRQNNFISVKETGVTFSSATAVTARCAECASFSFEPKTVVNMYCDHPFSYFIAHENGLIVGAGVLF